MDLARIASLPEPPNLASRLETTSGGGQIAASQVDRPLAHLYEQSGAEAKGAQKEAAVHHAPGGTIPVLPGEDPGSSRGRKKKER